jgi:hypothetical protein
LHTLFRFRYRLGGFAEGALNLRAGLAGAFLDAANQFIFFPGNELEIVIGKVGPFLFDFAFGNIPIAFNFEFIHILAFLLMVPAINGVGGLIPRIGGPTLSSVPGIAGPILGILPGIRGTLFGVLRYSIGIRITIGTVGLTATGGR